MDIKEEKQNQLVLLQNICSQEYYDFGNSKRQQVLKDISMEGMAKQSWAFLGDVAFELRLLLEIVSNARPYQKGRCVLAQRGMMRKKKIILPHVFYVGSTNMLFEHMIVLDYLKMINLKDKINVFELEKKLLQDLIDAGLGHISLTEIDYLTAQEKALFTLFTALYTESNIVIMNLARLPFSPKEIKILSFISEKIRNQEKIFMFSTKYPEVAEACATHLLVLYQGEVLYNSDINSFMNQYDKRILHIEDDHIQIIEDILRTKVNKCEFVVSNNQLDIFCLSNPEYYIQHIFKVLNQYQQIPKVLIQTTPSLPNAWKERKKLYVE